MLSGPKVVTAFLVLLGGVRQARADELDYLTVVWSAATVDGWSEADIADTCDRYARALTVDNGLWGLGVFRRYGCYVDGRLIAGEDGAGLWMVMIELGARDVTFVLYRSSKREATRLDKVYELSLSPAPWMREFVRNEGQARLVAAPVLLSLPAIGRIGVIEYAAGSQLLRTELFDTKVAAALPPDRVLVHSMGAVEGDEPIAGSPVVGRGVLVEESTEVKRWSFYDLKTVLPSDNLVVAATQGRYARAEVADLARRRYSGMFGTRNSLLASRIVPEALRENLASASFISSSDIVPVSLGLRYGQDVQGSESDFGQAMTFYGVTAQVRAGAAKGLRAQLDYVPTVASETTQVEFGARCFEIGRAFNFKMPFFVDHLDLTPNIGLWDVHSKIIIENPEDPTERHLIPASIPRALGLGVEAGAEFTASRFVARLWSSVDLTALTWLTDAQIRGTRVGADSIIRMVKLGDRRSNRWLAPMIFALREDLTIISSRAQTAEEDGRVMQFEGYEINYSMLFIGGGVAIIW